MRDFRQFGSAPRCAIVLGAGGRVGGAFAARLHRDGFVVVADPVDPVATARSAPPAYLFDGAYADGEAEAHIDRVIDHLRHWRDYAGIFLPSSAWIDEDHPYGQSKRAIEGLAGFYNSIGAHVVTDRIGYFPGDGQVADLSDPKIDQLTDGDALYDRVMVQMLKLTA